MDSKVLEEGIKDTGVVVPVRYIAVSGVREIARGADINTVVEKVIKLRSEDNNIGFSDVVVWDMGTLACPMMSVVASTCRGWLTINLPGRKYLSDNFGLSFTPKELLVLKRFFKVWKLEGGLPLVDAIKNLYEQTYVKDHPSFDLNRDEYKVFLNKLLQVISVSSEKSTPE
jgi:hypothetical protein